MKKEKIGEYILVQWTLGMCMFLIVIIVLSWVRYEIALEFFRYLPVVAIISIIIVFAFGFDLVKVLIEDFKEYKNKSKNRRKST